MIHTTKLTHTENLDLSLHETSTYPGNLLMINADCNIMHVNLKILCDFNFKFI